MPSLNDGSTTFSRPQVKATPMMNSSCLKAPRACDCTRLPLDAEPLLGLGRFFAEQLQVVVQADGHLAARLHAPAP